MAVSSFAWRTVHPQSISHTNLTLSRFLGSSQCLIRSYVVQKQQVSNPSASNRKDKPRCSWDESAEHFFKNKSGSCKQNSEHAGTGAGFEGRFSDVTHSSYGESRKPLSGSKNMLKKRSRDTVSYVDDSKRSTNARVRVSSAKIGVPEVHSENNAYDMDLKEDNMLEENPYPKWKQQQSTSDSRFVNRSTNRHGYIHVDKRRVEKNYRRDTTALSLTRVKGELLYGIDSVYAALQASQRKCFCLYVQENMPVAGKGKSDKKKDLKAIDSIIKIAVESGIKVKEFSKHDLNMLVDNKPHEGVVLDASSLYLSISAELEAPVENNGKAPPVWVALDEVTDPQNFGAILRSAHFLGACGVIVCERNSAPLSPVASKASMGALEVVELRACRNMAKFLGKSSRNGWRIIGADAAGSDVVQISQLPRGHPTILVLGGEGKGLRSTVKQSCDNCVSIPGFALQENQIYCNSISINGADIQAPDLDGLGEEFVAVDSLNVSVAAGILLHELLSIRFSSKDTIACG